MTQGSFQNESERRGQPPSAEQSGKREGKADGYRARLQRQVRDLSLPFILLISARFVGSINRGLSDSCIPAGQRSCVAPVPTGVRCVHKCASTCVSVLVRVRCVLGCASMGVCARVCMHTCPCMWTRVQGGTCQCRACVQWVDEP